MIKIGVMRYIRPLILILLATSCEKPYHNDLNILCGFTYQGSNHIKNMEKLLKWSQIALKTSSARDIAQLMTTIPSGQCYTVLNEMLPSDMICPLQNQFFKQKKRYHILKKMCFLPEKIEGFQKIPPYKRLKYLITQLSQEKSPFLKRISRILNSGISPQLINIIQKELTESGIYQCPLLKRFQEINQSQKKFKNDIRSLCTLPSQLRYLIKKQNARERYEDLFPRVDGILHHREARKLLYRYPTISRAKMPPFPLPETDDPYQMIPNPKLLPKNWEQKPLGDILTNISQKYAIPCPITDKESPINLNIPFETLYPISISFQPLERFMGRCRSTLPHEIAQKLKTLNSCISQKKPYIGVLKSRWMIATSGKTISINLSGNKKTAIFKCIQKQIKRWTFHPPGGLCQITGLFKFEKNLLQNDRQTIKRGK